MRILFVNHWAREIGGAEMSLMDIIGTLAKTDEVHLVTSEPGVLVERAEGVGVTAHVFRGRYSLYAVKRDALLSGSLRSFLGLVSFAVFCVRLSGLITRLKPDLVHANVPKSHAALFVAQLLGYRGPALFHLREIFESRSLAQWISALAYSRHASRLIAISDAVAQQLPASRREAAVVIHNGVALPNTPRRERGDAIVRFVYLGRVVPWKGCHQIIEAFGHLAASAPGRVELTIVGDTLYWDQSYRRRIEQQIESAGLAEICRLAPHTQRPYEVLAGHDVFCIASHREPFGRVVAEAQACGLPVVGFAGGAVAEIVEDGTTGLLVNYGDIEGLAAAMKRFVDDPAIIASMGSAGRVRAAERFNRDIQIPKIIAYLRSSVRAASPRRSIPSDRRQ